MIEGMNGQKMTQISQDDLVIKINHSTGYELTKCAGALRTVVLLHKVKIDMNGYGACEECSRTAYYNVPWPCKTIQDIAEELDA